MKNSRSFCSMCIATLMAGVFVSEAFAQIPQYVVKRTTGRILLDGRLDEDDWKAASTVGDFVFSNYTSGEKEPTEVRLLWDDEYLYVAFSVSDKWISAEVFNTRGQTFRDDCVELFMNPAPPDSQYYGFEINCIGVVSYFFVPYPKGLNRSIWMMPPQVSHTIDGTVNDDSDIDTGWTIEMAVRFSDYAFYSARNGEPPLPGDHWRIGLNRIGGKTNPQHSQWSPTIWGEGTRFPRFTFHAPQYFGKIIFSSEPVR